MVLTHDIADDAGAFAGSAIGLQAHLLHGVENAAMDGLESVADIGQRAPDDDRHRIVEIRLAHLVFNVDGLNVESARAAVAWGRRWSQWKFGILIIRHKCSVLRRDPSRCSGRPQKRGRFGILIVRHGWLWLLNFT